MTGSELRMAMLVMHGEETVTPNNSWSDGKRNGTYAFDVNLSNTSRVERTTREI